MNELLITLWLLFAPVSSHESLPRAWGPEQATGRPDTRLAGDFPTAWASATEDDEEEWLELHYETAVTPAGIRIHESHKPGAVAVIFLFDEEGDSAEVFRGMDPTPRSAGKGVSLIPIHTDVKTRRVRIELKSKEVKGWNQIDAVGLHGVDGSLQWATTASSSSTYADLATPHELRSFKKKPASPSAELAFEEESPAETLFSSFVTLRRSGANKEGLQQLAAEILGLQRRGFSRRVRPDQGFSGRWSSSFGTLVLREQENKVSGVYPLGRLSGERAGNRLDFTYSEGRVEGKGWFELSSDLLRFEGKWVEKGSNSWKAWTGDRLLDSGEDGKKWLYVLETPWESNLSSPDLSFGAMLRSIFGNKEGIEFRQRSFSDAESFRNVCGQAAFVDGPIYLVVAAHGETTGLYGGAGLISGSEIAGALADIPNLKFVHFSSCAVMGGEIPDLIFAARENVDSLEGIGGYEIPVDWMASALLEFTLLDLILNRGLSATRAAAEIPKILSFSGTKAPEGTSIPATHFRFRPGATK